ncbi:hypothetical protein [Proteiniphilum sp. UBA5384]|uniref:hypothetical protein n=1 Tax=Proteiniphilum sp. UBA5384 TaxID=1947279 RepID=UPI0025D3D84D|nr:hypothetical protein [Proteiniphilum sp. UBA5384]
MKKIPVLERLAREKQVLSEEEQRKFIGGGDGSQNNPYTQYEFNAMWSVGSWRGGYVGIYYYDSNGYVASSSGDYGSYGGSSGSYGSSGYYGSGSGNRDPEFSWENQFKWDNIKIGLLNKALSDYNINLYNFNIIGVSNGGSNAWIGEQWGQKVICLESSFFYMSNDTLKLRVLFEEYYHFTRDKSFNPTERTIQTTLPEPPTNIKSYILNDICGGDEYSYQYYMSAFNTLRDPQYYENEVNANRKVKELMYNDLSNKDRNEIDFKIWYYTAMQNNANNYY